MIAGIALAGGAWIFLAFLIVAFFGVAFGYFTVKGSGITPRSYGKMYGGAPGAKHGSDASGRHGGFERISDWSRGTRSPGSPAALALASAQSGSRAARM